MFKLLLAILTDLFSLSATSNQEDFEALSQADAMNQAGIITDDQTIPVALTIENDIEGGRK